MTTPEDQLLAVTPLDGRYADKVAPLNEITSEYGLIQRRVAVEVGWLSTLGQGVLPNVDSLDANAQSYLKNIPDTFNVEDAASIKDIERTTNHDVKAVEVWLRNKLGREGSFRDYLELIHFGCTSEDINNLAYAMMFRDARDDVLIPNIENIQNDLDEMAYSYAAMPMLARTHGQPATPTTLGKEMAIFADRLGDAAARLGSVAIKGKFNGATGNYNAVTVAYPEVNWPAVSKQFINRLGFEVTMRTTQIEPHDWMAVFFNELGVSNTISIDLARDMWSYIAAGYFQQQVKAGEVGSSTMPHKVNPIDFENAESNFTLANALLNHLATKLPISRLQRDLSDSSAQRAVGEAFGHTHVANSSLLRGLGKVHVNEQKLEADLDGEWSVLTEAVQTVMRRYKVPGAYDIIKGASRGKELTKEDYAQLIEGLEIPDEAKQSLKQLTPATYIGRAPELARRII